MSHKTRGFRLSGPIDLVMFSDSNSFRIISSVITRSSEIWVSCQSTGFQSPGDSLVKTELKNSERASAFSVSVTAQVPSWRLRVGILSVGFSFLFTWFQKTFGLDLTLLAISCSCFNASSSHLPDLIPHFTVVFVGILCWVFTKQFVAFLFL